MKSDNIKKGIQRAPHRSLLRACDLGDNDFDKRFLAALGIVQIGCHGFVGQVVAGGHQLVIAQQLLKAPLADVVGRDTTIKNGASRGYAITVAEDAHTTANRPAAQAVTLIAHYNEVWRTLTVPGNPLQVKSTETILNGWSAN